MIKRRTASFLAAAAIALSPFSAEAKRETKPHIGFHLPPMHSLIVQSAPIYPYSAQTVWTPLQWAAIFAAKQDWLGANPCIITGCQMQGKIYLNPSTNVFGASINFWGGPSGGTPGVAPANPQPGDMWLTTVGLYYYNGSSIIGPLTSQPTLTFPGTVATGATSGGVLCATSTTAIAMSGLLPLNALLVGGGAGACPASITTPASVLAALQLVTNSNPGGILTYGSAPVAGLTGINATVQTDVANTPNTATGLVAYNGAAAGNPPVTVNCTIPDVAAASTNWCTWKFANTGLVQPFFDTLMVQTQATCSTTFPVYEVFDVTTSTVIGSTLTAVNGLATLSINAAAGSATDTFAIRVTVLGSGCGATIANEFNTISLTLRGG